MFSILNRPAFLKWQREKQQGRKFIGKQRALGYKGSYSKTKEDQRYNNSKYNDDNNNDDSVIVATNNGNNIESCHRSCPMIIKRTAYIFQMRAIFSLILFVSVTFRRRQQFFSLAYFFTRNHFSAFVCIRIVYQRVI